MSGKVHLLLFGLGSWDGSARLWVCISVNPCHNPAGMAWLEGCGATSSFPGSFCLLGEMFILDSRVLPFVYTEQCLPKLGTGGVLHGNESGYSAGG